MPSVEDSRRWFLERVRLYTHESERPYFEAALDDLIAWSEARPGAVSFADDKDYDQKVVSFREHGRRHILWSAYPRRDDGAKLEILPGGADVLTPETRHRALQVLRSLSREPSSADATLRVPFRALKSTPRREQIKLVLELVLAELARDSRDGTTTRAP